MRTEAYINIALQTFGGILSLMIILFLLFVKKNNSKLEHLYIRFLGCNTILLFSNAVAWIFDGWSGDFGRAVVTIANFCIFFFPFLLIGLFSDYLVNFLTQRGADCRRAICVIWGMCILLILSVVVLQVNNMYFLIDGNNKYQRQSLFWISQLGALICLFFVFGLLLKHRKLLDKKECILFFSYILLPFGAVVVQLFTYGVVYLYISTTFIAICIYIFIQVEQERKLSEQALELERSRITIMMSQIHPHFLCNVLSGIKQLCDVEPQKASEALDHFTYYLRGNLYAITDPRLIPFQKELEQVKDYLYLEKMRFGNRLNIQWEIDYTDFLLPSLTLQTIVENAVRHGITKKEDGGTLTIRSELKVDIVLITVMDDGVGFDIAAPLDNSRPHIGIENSKNRLQSQCGGTLELQSKPDSGTKVTITLPREKSFNENNTRG